MHGLHRTGLAPLLALALALGPAVGTTIAQVPGGLNLQFSASPTTQQAGQTVTFSYSASPPAVAPPFASITNVDIDFGDGQSGTGNTGTAGQTVTGTVTHAYTSPGAYTARLSAQASNGGQGSTTTSVTIQGSAPPPNNGARVTFGVGWNLVAGPSGTVVAEAVGPLYTWQAGDTSYENVASGGSLTAGRGYWAYFNTATTGTVPSVGSQTSVVTAPAAAWFMIGNPGSTAATVTGVDAADTYSPATGTYGSGTTLQPGQGAWAWSWNGGSVTIRGQ